MCLLCCLRYLLVSGICLLLFCLFCALDDIYFLSCVWLQVCVFACLFVL